ncbi:20924_t:CDS:1, partial [Gigaspora rosea]
FENMNINEMNLDKFQIFINSHPNYVEDIFDQKDFRLVKVSNKIP